MLLNIRQLMDDAKCDELVRDLRWPDGVKCPACDSGQINKRGFHDHQAHRQRYSCQECGRQFDSRLANMAFLMLGIFGARSVQSGRLAANIPLHIKKPSIVRRMERFLDNGAVRVRTWYEPIARWLVSAAGVTGEIALVWDSTKVSAHHRLVLVGIAYRRRVVPLAWTWVRSNRGHSSTSLQLALLSYVRSLLPTDAQVSLVGD
jgi:DNA-directed RNA polymerase subunit RPC12/RpoP